MLLASPRYTARDVLVWNRLEEEDALRAQFPRLVESTTAAMDALQRFAANGPCYLSVSWGKDSVTVAHLAHLVGLRLPLVWVRVTPRENPDCVLVRDAFLKRFPSDYHEVEVKCSLVDGKWVAPSSRSGLTSGAGFEEATRRFGGRYITGIRAQESSTRGLRMRTHGAAGDNTCAPIGWWPTSSVFAYLHKHELPVHPAYACTGGGVWPRDRIRVGSLGGERGRGHGREDWEKRYYPEALRGAP